MCFGNRRNWRGDFGRRMMMYSAEIWGWKEQEEVERNARLRSEGRVQAGKRATKFEDKWMEGY
jgi:hypothetical protein